MAQTDVLNISITEKYWPFKYMFPVLYPSLSTKSLMPLQVDIDT